MLDLTGPVNPGGWLRFDGTRLAEERGTCYLSLGDVDLAEVVLAKALEESVSLRRRGALLTDLAVIGIQRRDVDHILRYAEEARDLAAQTESSGYVGRKLQGLRAKLAPFLADRRIARLSEQIAHLPTSA